MEKIITIFRKQMKVACDGKCHKAWVCEQFNKY